MLPEVMVAPLAVRDSTAFDWAAIAEAVTYPDIALRAGVEGLVDVDAVVSAEGRVTAFRSSPSTPKITSSLLIDAALRGIGSARLAPAPPYQRSVRMRVSFRGR